MAKTLEKDAKKDRADGAPSTPVTREIPAGGAAAAASSAKTNPVASGAKPGPATPAA